MNVILIVLLGLILSVNHAWTQTTYELVQGIVSSAKFKKATIVLENDHDRFVSELIYLTEIPAPPFKEQDRAKAYMEMLRQEGLSDVEMDAEGNVMGVRKGIGSGPMLAVLAHLDTVFPAGTDVKVRREGIKLMAPGIGDDTCGLALILAVIRAMNAAKFITASDILFVGDVGEEGKGNLRGVKYLLQKGKYKDRIGLFISVDGKTQRAVTIEALGSKRVRVVFKGPGGHSYAAFGRVNPAYALGNAIVRFSHLNVPDSPKTTFNVGIIGGGISINSIPGEVYMDVDMRSESRDELENLYKSFMDIIGEAVEEENRTRSTARGEIKFDIKLFGERPFGKTRISSPIVQITFAAFNALGLFPSYDISSTDSNIPMSMGIPAVTIGSGIWGGRAHSLEEWVDVEKKSTVEGARVVLAVITAVAGAQ